MNQTAPQSNWPSRLNRLLNRFDQIPKESMGFPEKWEDIPVWSINLQADDTFLYSIIIKGANQHFAADSLANSQVLLVDILKLIAKDMYPNYNLNVFTRAVQTGSIEIEQILEVVVPVATSMTGSALYELSKSIFTTFVQSVKSVSAKLTGEHVHEELLITKLENQEVVSNLIKEFLINFKSDRNVKSVTFRSTKNELKLERELFVDSDQKENK